MQELNLTQAEEVSGGKLSFKCPPLPIKKPPMTTLALGEEGGGGHMTTMMVGEEGPVVTTLAIGEEGGGTATASSGGALGAF